MNKNTLLLLAIATTILTMGAGCANKPTTSGDISILPYNGAPGPSDPVVAGFNGKYENSKYGFSLDFPKTWEGYTTKERTLDWRKFGTTDSVDFGFVVQDSLFNISMFTKDQWQEVQLNLGEVPNYLGENSQYIFGYALAQDAPSDTIKTQVNEIKDILKTFKLKENIKTVLYSNKDYGFNIVTNKGCEKYLKATNSYVGGTMTGGDVVRSVEVTLPLAKQKGGVWLNYQLASQVEFDKIVESSKELPGSPRIILNLDNNMVLFMTGIIQSTEMPPLTDLPANCGVKAEKI